MKELDWTTPWNLSIPDEAGSWWQGLYDAFIVVGEMIELGSTRSHNENLRDLTDEPASGYSIDRF